ncbi:M6 family metalloprotease domain-containing protein [bacterium]|nr:M6 family metalloprotease domain-containing protein [bacterium]
MISSVLTIFVITVSGFALTPAQPGVTPPPVIIEFARNWGGDYYLYPALVNTMKRYAEAKRDALKYGLDEIDDVYGYFPVICGLYADSGAPNWPVSNMQQQLFDGPWPTGTMREYYEEISFDQFHLDGIVYDWVQSSMTLAYVCPPGSFGYPEYGGHLDEFLIELLQWNDPFVNFGQYDNDGPDGEPNSGDDDGFVDAMFFIHDGAGAETGANNIWSHSWNMLYLTGSNFYTDDPCANGGPIKIGPYIIQPSVNGSGGMIEIGVFCHEFGHALGLPDLYDTDYSSEGIGVWGLMSGGSWNTPAKPSHMISWSRYKLGWIDPIEVYNWQHNTSIPPIETTGTAYKLWTNGSYGGNQYFMIENRQAYGFDINVRGEGLTIWHVDEAANQQNEDHPKVDMEEADGFDHLYYNSNSGDAGDVFPGITNNNWFDEFSYPNSLNYWNNPTQVAVWDIELEGENIITNLDVVYFQPLLEFTGYDLEDIIGNNDGRADPGETIELWIFLENQWAAAVNVTGELSTSSGDITIIDPSGSFGAIASQGFGNNQSNPFQFSISPDAVSGEWHDFEVLLSDAGGYSDTLSFSLLIGRPPILLVDDDQGEDYEGFIANGLENADALYEIWEVASQGAPIDEIMLYESVIWMTGDDSLYTLTTYDITYLQQFIDAGGTLIMTGQNINEDIGSTNFFTDYLKCQPSNGDVNQVMLTGVPENPVSSGMNLMIVGVYGAFNQTSPSSVMPIDIAEPLFIYTNGEIGGVNYYYESTGAHVVYLAFGLEAVSGMGGASGSTTIAQILQAVFDWADTQTGINHNINNELPDETVLKGNYPNPFNNSTVIGFELRDAGEISLVVYDIQGREVQSLVTGHLSSGQHEVIWNAEDFSSGIYFAKLKADNFTQTRKMLLIK